MNSLTDQIDEGDGRRFAIEEVLYPSFEEDIVEYHEPQDVSYPLSIVSPKRLEDNIWLAVDDVMSGYKISVGSYYEDEANVVGDADSRVLFGGDSVTVTVMYRAVAYVTDDGITITEARAHVSTVSN